MRRGIEHHMVLLQPMFGGCSRNWQGDAALNDHGSGALELFGKGLEPSKWYVLHRSSLNAQNFAIREHEIDFMGLFRQYGTIEFPDAVLIAV